MLYVQGGVRGGGGKESGEEEEEVRRVKSCIMDGPSHRVPHRPGSTGNR